MKKRFLAFFLFLISAFLLLTPAFAISSGRTLYIMEDYAQVLSTDTHVQIATDNFNIENSYDTIYITVVAFESWDGDLSSELVTNAMKDLHIKHPERSYGMTIMFDIEQGNYEILVGGRIDDLFSDTLADKYIEKYFRRCYDEGNYDGATLGLVRSLAYWYKDNLQEITLRQRGDGYPFFLNPLFIVFEVLIIIALLHLLYGVFARLAHLRHCFEKFYIEQELPIPFFTFRHIRSAPFYCVHEITVWSCIVDMWNEPRPLYSCFEQTYEKRNILDFIAIGIKSCLFLFIKLIILLLAVFMGGGGSYSAHSGSHSSSNSHSSSGSGGGGHSGGGGGGHR